MAASEQKNWSFQEAGPPEVVISPPEGFLSQQATMAKGDIVTAGQVDPGARPLVPLPRYTDQAPKRLCITDLKDQLRIE